MTSVEATLPPYTCKTCAFFIPNIKALTGTCHCFPPVVIVNQIVNMLNSYEPNVQSHFPTVNQDTWCGEYAEQQEFDDINE